MAAIKEALLLYIFVERQYGIVTFLTLHPQNRPFLLTRALFILVSYTHLTLSSPSYFYNQSLEIQRKLILLLCQVLGLKLRRSSQ